MFVTSIVTPFLGVNCYIVAAESVPSPGDAGQNGSGEAKPCVLVDAGLDCAEPLAGKLAETGLEPAAILLTHGHPDHVLGLPELLERWPVPTFLAEADEWWLDDPAGSLGPEMAATMEPALAGRAWERPDLDEWPGGEAPVEVAGLDVTAIPAPGHTDGSTLWKFVDGADEHIFSGDVLFASGVGRTDLPGGDQSVMDTTLATVIPSLDREAPVHPGHGPSTTVGEELDNNPFLSNT